MKSADAAEAAKHSSEFSRLLYVQERWLHAQAQQIAACNVRHTIMQRLCCWLLRAYDLAEGGELLVTQEHLGQILGVQRASICLCASRLQEQALIQYRRGHLRILDKDRLAEHACECHHVLRRMRKLLMHGDAPRASAHRDLARALQ